AEHMGMAISAETFNPVIVDFYEATGFLPDAIINYLALLGWSLDDSREDFTREELVQHFTLERVQRAPASFDPQKLLSFQQRAMAALPVEQRATMCLAMLQRAGMVKDPAGEAEQDYVTRIVAAAGERIVIAGDIFDFDDFFVADENLPYDEKAFEKRLRKPPEARPLLAGFRDELAAADTFDAEALEQRLHAYVEAQGVAIGQIIHALRVA